jgi:hypothetical protein
MAGHYDITIRRGDTYQDTFTVAANLLTNYTALMQWRDKDGTVKVTCSSTAAPSTMTIAVGSVDTVITPIITAVQTALLEQGTLYYDCQITSPAGVVTTILEGTVTVTADVSI